MTPAARTLSLRTWGFLLLVLCGFYWLGNESISLFDRDEPRFAEPAREMYVARDWKDWIVPHLNGVPHFHKPPLCYWQMALAYRFFGVNEFSARFFSGLWTALAAVIIAKYLSRRVSPSAGLAAGLAFATSLLVIVLAKMAISDATLVLLTIVAALSLWDIYLGSNGLGPRLLLWIATGIGILCKGPAILVVLIGLTVVLLILDRDREWVWKTGWQWGVPAALVIGLPWYVAANLLSGGGLRERFWGYDLYTRFVAPVEGHGGPPGYYLGTALVGTWPWSAFLAPVAAFAWRNRSSRMIKFLLAWLIGPTVLLEIVRTKMFHYWLIVLPAYAILVGLAVDEWIRDPEQRVWTRWRGWITGVLAAVWLLVAVGVFTGLWFLFRQAVPVMWFVGGTTAAMAGVVLLSLRWRNPATTFVAVVLTAVVFASSVAIFVLPALEPFKLSRQLAHAMKLAGNDGTVYVLIEWSAPSTVFYLHSGDRNVVMGSAKDLASFVGAPGVVVGMSEKGFREVQKVLTNPPRGLRLFGVSGYEYTLGRKMTAYVAAAGQGDGRRPDSISPTRR